MRPLLDNIELLDGYVEAVLPRLRDLAVTEETEEQASFAILRCTGDKSFVEKLINECDDDSLATEYQRELEDTMDSVATRKRQSSD